MTIQEQAQALIAMSADQVAALREWSQVEDMTFEAFASAYVAAAIPPPPYVPPANVAPRVAPAAGSGLQPALRLTPPTTQLSCTVRHYVYYPDAIAIQQHAQVALSNGWSGVVLWALGYETADVYAALANTTP